LCEKFGKFFSDKILNIRKYLDEQPSQSVVFEMFSGTVLHEFREVTQVHF